MFREYIFSITSATTIQNTVTIVVTCYDITKCLKIKLFLQKFLLKSAIFGKRTT